MKIRWRPAAVADRHAIFDYIARRSARAAIQLDEDFTGKVASAAQHPSLYRIGRVPGTREIIVRTNYVIVYRIDDDGITILRVLHAARRWPQE